MRITASQIRKVWGGEGRGGEGREGLFIRGQFRQEPQSSLDT